MNKVIFWDFQGTLAKNDWMFSKALYKVLLEHDPSTSVRVEDIKKKPMIGFPWQDHEKDYLHLTSRDSWWKHVEHIFIDVYRELNISEEVSILLAQKVRLEIINSDEFALYDDTIEMLSHFQKNGFKNIILSNHIPELEKVVERLGLSPYISLCISSANVGYEKPNPEIYKYALNNAGQYDEVWMVGDNILADVKGAEAVGIKGVLVRSENHDSIPYYSKDLRGLERIII